MRRFPILLVVFLFGFSELSFGQQIRWHGGSFEAWKVQSGLRSFISCTTGLVDCWPRKQPSSRRQPTKKQDPNFSFSAARPRSANPTGRQQRRPVITYASDDNPNGITMAWVDTVLPDPNSPPDNRRPTVVIPREDVVKAPAESVTVEMIGNLRLSNGKNFSIDVYDGNSYMGRLAPNEWWLVGEPQANYQGWAMRPAAGGKLAPVYVPLRPTDTGWIF